MLTGNSTQINYYYFYHLLVAVTLNDSGHGVIESRTIHNTLGVIFKRSQSVL